MARLHVAVGVILDDRQRVLVARRAAHRHQGGRWEFPGGKVEPGETVVQALCRELEEELAITPTRTSPMMRIEHDYPDRRVDLDVHRVSAWRGEPRGLEGQPLAWLKASELARRPFPQANLPIIRRLALPPFLIITEPLPPGDLAGLARRLQSLGVPARGAWLQLRLPDWDDRAYGRALALAIRTLGPRGVDVTANRSPAVARRAGGHALHLNGRALMACEARPEGFVRVGASCHSPEELARAEALGLDYALLSPVAATASHPRQVPLGWERFRNWLLRVDLPVYALGGLGPESLEVAWAHGAHGVAGIRGFWPLHGSPP
ncbi:Nudix family hydrolase [Alkalilimnicola ehrlichii]|uniref:Nudix family hydrolase n=1 Tax=Alkalilimnicola ehrlichii TaxID=351052 RepID=UPI003B9F7306